MKKKVPWPTVREHLARGLLPSGRAPGRCDMSIEHARHLIDTYPRLYKLALAHTPNVGRSEPVVCSEPFEHDGFTVGDGWFKILDKLSAILAADPNLVVTQCKEKNGTLRFHFGVEGLRPEGPRPEGLRPEPSSSEVEAAYKAAREESAHTCEMCGDPGKLEESRDHWLSVRCLPCAWLDDMAEACRRLAAIFEGKDIATFVADRADVEVAKYHIRCHLGTGASHQSPERRARLPGVGWAKLDLWATIDSTDKMEQTEGDFTMEELEAMIFRVSPEDLWKFIHEDVPVIKDALR